PVIRIDLDLNATQVGSFMSAFYFALAAGAIPAGVLADRLGVARSLATAALAMALGAALFAGVASYPPAVAATFVMGLGYALVNPATAKGVLSWFRPEHRATAMGVKQMGVPMGGLLASGFGAAVVFMPWRWALWIVAGLTLGVGAVWWRLARGRTVGGGGLRAALADLRAVLGNRRLGRVNAASVTFNAGQQAFGTYLTLFLRDAAGASQPFAALCVGLSQVTGATGRVFWAFASDRFAGGRRKGVLVAIMTAAAATMFTAAAVSPSWHAGVLAALALVLGATVLAYAALLHTLCAEAVDPRLAGAAIGSNLFATSLGGAVWPILFGLIVDHAGYATAWTATGVLVLGGVGLVGLGYREADRD
ncbi:MAG: MFS transporter, partial [Rhodospirillaceae bacterium]